MGTFDLGLANKEGEPPMGSDEPDRDGKDRLEAFHGAEGNQG